MVKTILKMSAMVVSAIRNLREVHGSTSREIMNYITSEYDTSEPAVQRQMYAALKRGLAYGILKRVHGHYCLNTEPEPVAPAQETTTSTPMDTCCRRMKKKKKKCKAKSNRKRSSKRKRKRSCRMKKKRKSCRRKKKKKRCRRGGKHGGGGKHDMFATDVHENHSARYGRVLERSHSCSRNSRSRSRSSGTSAGDRSSSRLEKLTGVRLEVANNWGNCVCR